MEEFNKYYLLAQKMLSDPKVTTLIAVFEVKVNICDRNKLHQKFIINNDALIMINGTKQITIKIN